MYDTFGFPLDLTKDVAEKEGLTVDIPGYDAAMEAQKQRSRVRSTLTCSTGTGHSPRSNS